jgi:hypothetical protein
MGSLNEAVGKRTFAMVDVGYDAKIPDMLHVILSVLGCKDIYLSHLSQKN